MNNSIGSRKRFDLPAQRTVNIVESSIKKLLKKKLQVSIDTIITTSKSEDPLGKGISRSALLRNPAAYALYVAHRDWVPKSKRSLNRRNWTRELTFIRVTADKNAKRRRLRRYSKRDLVEILIEVSERYCSLEAGMLQESIRLYDAL